jgi:Flp pilus assembly pilin Flp
VTLAAAILADDSGQGLAEYALILALIATVCLVVLTSIGIDIRTTLTKLSTDL